MTKRWIMTDARLKALKTGEAIRNICCMDSLANRYFDDPLRAKIREICDEQMHILGYESLTEHRDRTRELLERPEYYNALTDRQVNKLFKYQRLPNNV